MPLSEEAKAALAARSQKTNPAKTAARKLSAAELAEAMTRKVPDAIADLGDPTGDAEVDSEVELNAIQQGFKDRAKRENERYTLAVDTAYWFVLCFTSRADKEKFLKRSGMFDATDGCDKYLDGYAVAEALGVDMTD